MARSGGSLCVRPSDIVQDILWLGLCNRISNYVHQADRFGAIPENEGVRLRKNAERVPSATSTEDDKREGPT